MNIKNLSQRQKFILILLVLVVLSFGFLYLRREKEVEVAVVPTRPIEVIQPTPYPLSGSYGITLAKTNYNVGEKFTAAIEFTVEGREIFGTDVVLHFDPQILGAESTLIVGDYFQNYPRQEVDNAKGLIKVTAFGANKEKPSQNANVFSVTFTPKKAGVTAISFDFEERRTDLTTLVEEGTSRNILAQANPVQIVIEP